MENRAARREGKEIVEYGFYGRLKAGFPSQIIVDITEVCNLSCIHCLHREFRRSGHYSAAHLDPELNARMVDEVRRHGRGLTRYIRYTGDGEPLLHPGGYEMIEHAVRHSGVFVTLTTNGTVLDERRTERLLDSGIHMIDISIDAYSAETYARIRIGGDLSVTRANVLRLIEMVRSGGYKTRVVVSYVEQPLNLHETADFEGFWKDHGADYVVIRRLHSCSGAKGDLAEQMRRDNGRRRPCLYPWERIVLKPKGVLTFCPANWFEETFVSEYRGTTIRETWQGEYYQDLRRAHLCNDFSTQPFCGQCPDWSATRWPSEGRSYADMIEEFIEDEHSR